MEASALTPLLHADPSLSWASWSREPTVIAGIVAAGGGYAVGLGRRGGRLLEPWRPFAFAGGLLVLVAALLSPLDPAGEDYLLSLHMLQHMLLAVVAPPLLLLGLPPWLVRDLLPPGVRRALLATLTRPVTAAALFTIDMWLWHVPGVYQVALGSLPIHVVMHLAFIAGGVLFWWPIIEPVPDLATLAAPAKTLYLFVTGLPMALLALVLLASPGLLYPHYADAPRLWGVSPLADQQIAGLIMGALGETGSFVAFSLLFVRAGQEQPY